jgi:GR25 family glycosyltransferase involved in LPS biosynthesis
MTTQISTVRNRATVVAAAVVLVLCACVCAISAAVLGMTVQRYARAHGTYGSGPGTAKPRIRHAYVIHDPARRDRGANAATLHRLAAASAEHSNIWRATIPSRDAASRDAYEMCPTPRVLIGEYGCTASHMAALEHAIANEPGTSHTPSWVLVYEDDALPRRTHAHVITRLQSALRAAERLHINAVFMGWFYEQEIVPAPTRIDATLWRAPAPFSTVAYALRLTALPELLAKLKQLHCTVPVDCIFKTHFRDVLLVTRARNTTPRANDSMRGALFHTMRTPSSIAKPGETRTSELGAAFRAERAAREAAAAAAERKTKS